MKDMELRKLLLKIGISANKQGFFYIIRAKEIINKQGIRTNLSTIYEMISKESDKSIYQIERAIRYSIQQSYKNNEILKEIYGKCPDNSVFLYDLVFNFDLLEETIKYM